jgi:hypothetical protein
LRLWQAETAIRNARKARDTVNLIDLGHGEYTPEEARNRLRLVLSDTIYWIDLARIALTNAQAVEEPP